LAVFLRFRRTSGANPGILDERMATTSNFEREQAWSAAFVTTTPSDNAKRFASARRHTRVVRFLRRTLPVVAAGLVILYVGIVLKMSGLVSGMPQITLPNIIPDNLEMANPHYQGFNADGGSYVVDAKTAVQSLTDTSLITLNSITGVLTDANKVKTHLKSVHGLYNSKTEQLELYDGIDVVSENGMHAVMSRATVINKQNVVITKEPVTVQMPTGTVRAKEMTLHNKTREVTFLNAVQTHLIPADDKKPPATAGTAPSAGAGAPATPPATGAPTPSAAPAATTQTTSAAPMLSASNGPIDITSNRLDINDNTKVAIFSGNVRAVQAGAALETAGLTVTYEGQNAGTTAALGANSKIRRIVSSTPIVMTRPPHDRVTGKSLDFDALTEVAVITGDVVMTSQADRKVTGAVATIDQKADTVLLVGSVVAIQGRNQLGGERLFVERAKALTHLTSPGDAGGEPGRITSRFYRTVAKASPKASKQWQTAFASGATAAVFKTNPTAPIDIEADRLDVDDHAKEAVYKGDVHAKQGEFQIRTIEMHALYTGQAGLAEQKDAVPAQQQGAQLTRIEARGKVIVTSKDGHNATGDWANYDVKSNKVTVGGDVVLTQEKNIVRGNRLLIDMATGESVIQNDSAPAWSATAAPETSATSTGFVVQKPTVNARPSAIFYPRRKEGKDGKEAKEGKDAAEPPTNGQAATPSSPGTTQSPSASAIDGWQSPSPAP
jgi:LPS export ABC transporter protein LptC/lipopolysaccharide transport protein LptA